jgi:hypothetical protein
MRYLIFLFLIIPTVLFAESYWQQDVHYKIDATLNPADNTIIGNETLVYKNNSPDELKIVYFHLYWNLFTKGSYGDKLAKRNKQYYDISSSGIDLLKFAISENDTQRELEYNVDNTLMEVKLLKPLKSGDSLIFIFEWKGRIPEGGYRCGHQGRDYNIAQWYPQIATYDKYGWDRSQYLGPAEFHNEYGTFDVNISIPKSFTLGYSGEILNPEEIYADSILKRLKESEGDTETVRIADYSKTEWSSADSVLVRWKFHADNVRDFAWSANEHYIWDVTHWSPALGAPGIRIHSLYFADKAEFWKYAARYTQHTISYLSQHFGLYAYPNCFVVEGVVGGGMEYPGITFIGHYGDKNYHSPFGVITHEVAHNWFPMMVGSNETYYGFMDEGFVTFLTALATEDYFGRYNNSFEWTEWYQKFFGFPNDDERQGIQRNSLELAMSGYEEPIVTHMYRFQHGQAGSSIYSKTGSVLFMLQYVLGDSTFESVMKEYFNRWRFKHPYPEDFYAAVQEASGNRDLRWFFDEWLNKTVTCDYGLCGFDYKQVKKDNKMIYQTKLKVHRYRPAIMPVDVKIDMADGGKETVWFPIDKWLNAEVDRDTTIDLPSKPIRAVLNPDGLILDINRLNNQRPLPKFRLQFDNTVFSITPVDAYLIKWRPSLWFTDRGGWNVGYKLSGSYLDNLLSTSLWQTFNTRDNTFDHDITLSHNTYSITPLSNASLRLYRIEGRKGASISLQKELRNNYSVPPYHTFRLTYSYSHINDGAYLWNPETWDKGNLHRIVVGYYYYNRGSFWSVNASATLESPTSLFGRSDFEYSKRTFQIRSTLNMPGGWDLALRFYNGIGYGDIPNQTKYYFSGSSPLEQLNEPLMRSRGIVPSKFRDHSLSTGGGYMRGYYRVFKLGDKIDAFNAEARFSSLIPFVNVNVPVLNYLTNYINSSFFFDAGRIAMQSQKLWDQRFEVDCGFGLRLTSFWNILGEFARSDLFTSIGLNTIRIDFPIYDSMPVLSENKLKLRWVLGFSQSL